MRHIHFGAGHFGLGFATWLFSRANIPTVLVARLTSDSHRTTPDTVSRKRRNELLKRNKSFIVSSSSLTETAVPFENVRIADFVEYDDTNPAATDLRQYFETEDALCVTFAIGALRHYETPAILLRRGLAARRERGALQPVFAMALEDHITISDVISAYFPESDRLAETSPLIGLDVSVDRVCSMMNETSQKLELQAEPYAALVIQEHEAADPLKNAFQTIGGFVRFSRFVEFEKNKARWIVEGSRALIALTAEFYGIGALSDFFKEDGLPAQANRPSRVPPSVRARNEFAKEIISEIGEGFRCFAKQTPAGRDYLAEYGGGLERFIDQTYERFVDTYDTTGRVISHFVCPPSDFDRHPAAHSYLKRSGIEEPIHSYIAVHGAPPRHVTVALVNLLVMIADGDLLKSAD